MEAWYYFLLSALFLPLIENKLASDHKVHVIRLIALLLWLTGVYLMAQTSSIQVVSSIGNYWFVVGLWLWFGYLVWYLIRYWLWGIIETIRRML